MRKEDTEQLSASLRKVLNTHGHGFHYAVIKKSEQLHSEKRSKWIFDGAEFPVSVQGQTTHVDFILTTRSGQTLLVAECKRADPARAMWCFAHAPYTWRDSYDYEVTFETLMLSSGATKAVRKPKSAHTTIPVYHLGFELRTDQQGDGGGQNNAAINQAVTQVLRSTSGVINHLSSDARLLRASAAVTTLIPTVFTTAELWTTEVDLGAAELISGNLDQNAVSIQRVEWIWLTHNQSPALGPEPARLRSDQTDPLLGVNRFSDDLRWGFARSVAIVNPSGIDSFLHWDLEEWLN